MVEERIKCDFSVISGCELEAKIVIVTKIDTRKLCLHHGLEHIKLMLLKRRKRKFTVERL